MKRFLAALLAVTLLIGLMIPIGAVAATQYATVVGGWLRLRSTASFSSGTINSYYTGTQVQILQVNGKWYNVQTPDGLTGYMYGDYLALGGSVVVPDGNTDATVVSSNGYGVRMRQGPSTGYAIIRKYAVGTRVQILEYGSGWSRISVGGVVGYMMNQFLNRDGGVTPYYGGDATVWSANGYGVRLRSGPGTSYSKIGVYSIGTQVRILTKGSVWDYVQIGSRTGYMMNQFLIYNNNYEVTAISINNLNPVVGNTLVIQSVTPASATLTYQWYVGGKLKPGATNASYLVTADDADQTIQLVAYGTGNYTGTAYSAITAKVASSSVITGVEVNNMYPVVGDLLSVTGTTPANATVSYKWVIGGTKTVTTPTYPVVTDDIGKTIELTVTGIGNFTGSKTIATGAVTATGAITDLTITNVTNPGKDPDVGDTIKVVPVPATATATYQWTVGTETSAAQTLTVKDTWHNTTLTVTATGTGSYSGTPSKSVTIGMPALTVGAISFDNVQEGYAQPAPKYLTVENTGSAKAHITAVTVDANFTVSPASGTVEANATADKVWAVQPKTGLKAGSYCNNVTFTYDDKSTATTTIAMTVTEAAPNLQIDPIDFGEIWKESTLPAPKTITIKNVGLVKAEGVTVSLGGAAAADYTLTAPTTTTIPANGTITFTLVPKNKATGSYDASVTASSTTAGAIAANATVKFKVNFNPSLTAAPLTKDIAKGSTEAIPLTLTASADADITNIRVTSFSPSQGFTLSAGKTTIKAGDSDTSWTLIPGSDLPVKDGYEVKVTFNYYGMVSEATATITINIKDAVADSAAAPETVPKDGSTGEPAASTVIDTVALDYIAPATGEVPATQGSGTGYSYQIIWNPDVTDVFAAETTYTAAITLKADDGYTFADTLSVTANGSPLNGSNGSYSATFATGAAPVIPMEPEQVEATPMSIPETPSEPEPEVKPEPLTQAVNLLWSTSANGVITASWSAVEGASDYLITLYGTGAITAPIYNATETTFNFPSGAVTKGCTFTVSAIPQSQWAEASLSLPSAPYTAPQTTTTTTGTDVLPSSYTTDTTLPSDAVSLPEGNVITTNQF